MFAMGTMLRKTGAFFMRRSFSNDELYWDIFREYMYALVSVYHIGLEFFIEGTRSRNFKALVPKVGLHHYYFSKKVHFMLKFLIFAGWPVVDGIVAIFHG